MLHQWSTSLWGYTNNESAAWEHTNVLPQKWESVFFHCEIPLSSSFTLHGSTLCNRHRHACVPLWNLHAAPRLLHFYEHVPETLFWHESKALFSAQRVNLLYFAAINTIRISDSITKVLFLCSHMLCLKQCCNLFSFCESILLCKENRKCKSWDVLMKSNWSRRLSNTQMAPEINAETAAAAPVPSVYTPSGWIRKWACWAQVQDRESSRGPGREYFLPEVTELGSQVAKRQQRQDKWPKIHRVSTNSQKPTRNRPK